MPLHEVPKRDTPPYDIAFDKDARFGFSFSDNSLEMSGNLSKMIQNMLNALRLAPEPLPITQFTEMASAIVLQHQVALLTNTLERLITVLDSRQSQATISMP